MRIQVRCACSRVALLLLTATCAQTFAAPAADQLMPAATVGFVSIPDAAELRDRFDQTQVGLMLRDPTMRPFADQIRAGIEKQLGAAPERVGVALDDIVAAAGGEASIGLVKLAADQASVLATIDCTGKQIERQAMLARVDQRLRARGARAATQTVGAAHVTTYTLPPTEKRPREAQILIATAGDLVLAADDAAGMRGLLARAAGGGDASLSTSEAYRAAMRRLKTEDQGIAANLRWFIVPSEYDIASRSLQEKLALPDKKDLLTILREQGFDGIRGVAGFVHVAVDPGRDFIHRTTIYAPAQPGARSDHARDKYRLAMQIAELPNRNDLSIQPWAPRMAAKYSTFSLDIPNAFDKVEPLYNALAGYDDAYRTTLDGFEKDPFGAQVNLREQLVRHLGSRVTFVTDYKQPIVPDCERYLIVIETKNPSALAAPINRLMEKDNAVRKSLAGVEYWEVLPEQQSQTSTNYDGSLLPLEDDFAQEPQEERVLRRAAVCLHGADLLVASDAEFLAQVLEGVARRESLAEGYDFQAAVSELDRVAPAARSAWAFVRTEEIVRPTYELIRANRMPEAETFLGRLMNKMLTTEQDLERGVIRKQRIDGASLPSFEVARRYFGPSARAIRTDKDGWLVTGVVLSKAAG
ncbi:hypothetical protein Pla175_15490 [Pirellulimonas nuda]|uniref:DUF3352 domain-containing protein n=1 Tax=Pirellulimonas nuda TaxID=2528009 RepID=A0A518D9R8_9BACT|nr:hypothetical protein [Pirellulimonas nuda]QDU88178.1 hypothetical protein Pla175_15490 [Pirellulimonas nuda]